MMLSDTSDTALYNVSAMAKTTPRTSSKGKKAKAKAVTKAIAKAKVTAAPTPKRKPKQVKEPTPVLNSAASTVASGTTTAPIDRGEKLSFGQVKIYLGLAHSTLKYHVYGRAGKNGTEGGTLRPDGAELGRQYWYTSTLDAWRVGHQRATTSA